MLCKKGSQVYIGETKITLKFLISEHGGYILNQDTSKATAFHFNLPADLQKYIFLHNPGFGQINLPEKNMWITKKISKKLANLFKSHKKMQKKTTTKCPNVPQKA